LRVLICYLLTHMPPASPTVEPAPARHTSTSESAIMPPALWSDANLNAVCWPQEDPKETATMQDKYNLNVLYVRGRSQGVPPAARDVLNKMAVSLECTGQGGGFCDESMQHKTGYQMVGVLSSCNVHSEQRNHLMKQQIDPSNPCTPVWHGTDHTAMTSIGCMGLSMRFASRPAGLPGLHVTKCARKAMAYSTPDTSGNQYLLLLNMVMGPTVTSSTDGNYMGKYLGKDKEGRQIMTNQSMDGSSMVATHDDQLCVQFLVVVRLVKLMPTAEQMNHMGAYNFTLILFIVLYTKIFEDAGNCLGGRSLPEIFLGGTVSPAMRLLQNECPITYLKLLNRDLKFTSGQICALHERQAKCNFKIAAQLQKNDAMRTLPPPCSFLRCFPQGQPRKTQLLFFAGDLVVIKESPFSTLQGLLMKKCRLVRMVMVGGIWHVLLEMLEHSDAALVVTHNQSIPLEEKVGSASQLMCAASCIDLDTQDEEGVCSAHPRNKRARTTH